MRSSIDGLFLVAMSESLDVELSDGAREGLAGGCSIGVDCLLLEIGLSSVGVGACEGCGGCG